MSDEPTSYKLRTSTNLSVEGDALRTLVWRTSIVLTPRQRRAPPAAGDFKTRPRAELDTVGHVAANDVLRRDQFLHEVEREKRRADRTKSPVSIVRWHLHADQDPPVAMGLIAILDASRRNTDILGELGPAGFAILLPGTGPAGAEVFVRKIAEKAPGLRVSATVATYPDSVVASIARGEAVPEEAEDLGGAVTDRRRRFDDGLKRAIDVVLTSAILVAVAPLMITTAIAVAVTSRGPVIFRQSRLGKGGATFDFYKFRSMHQSNDDRIHREFVATLIQGRHDDINEQSRADPLFKIKNDPRVTPVGRFIRSTSIDELPQLFNVLKGDMSLVGPRPPLAYEATHYQSWHLRRILEIRPGITGLWQVEGRSRVSFDEMVRMDLRYIKQRSLALDFKLLVRTVGVVLARRGAK